MITPHSDPEAYAALWGCDPSYDRAPNLHGDGCLFYNFSVEGDDPEFLKRFLGAIDRTLSKPDLNRRDRMELNELRDIVQDRIKGCTIVAVAS